MTHHEPSDPGLHPGARTTTSSSVFWTAEFTTDDTRCLVSSAHSAADAREKARANGAPADVQVTKTVTTTYTTTLPEEAP